MDNTKKRILFLRPYYGINIHSDAHGELGEHLNTRDIFPDLTLLTAATVFEQSDEYEVELIDAVIKDRMLPDELLNYLNKRVKEDNIRYDIIVMRMAAPTVRSDIQLAKEIRNIIPEVKIYVGGHAAKALRKWIEANVDAIDTVIEEPMDEFALRYVGKDVDQSMINSFPTPDYTLVDYKKYVDDNKRVRLTLMASRGCPMSCTYCPYKAYYKRVEYRDVELVISDMKTLVALGTDVIQFRDQFFSSDKARTRKIFERIIEENIKVEIVCETRLTSLDEELIALMKNAGVIVICFGVESGDFELLKQYNSVKGRPNRMKELIAYANSLDIITMAFYIIGFPEETWEMAESTYHYADDLDSTYAIFNMYEDCDFTSLGENVSPDLFTVFGNTTTIESQRKLSKEERQYIVWLYSIMYTMRISFEGGYSYNYKLITSNKKMIEKLQPYAEDLYALSECVRGMESI